MQIPLVDLQAQFQSIKPKIMAEIEDVLDPTPIHLQPACAHYGYKRRMLPVTEAVTDRIVSLPMYPELTTEQTQRVVHTVKRNIMSGITSL